ncbi:hypothetical protein [Anaerotruncus sp. AF02-27]|nr:hypothetical protein [Anaerotruncus sp. AF02-27]
MDYRNLGAAAFYDADGIAAQIHDGDTVALGGCGSSAFLWRSSGRWSEGV